MRLWVKTAYTQCIHSHIYYVCNSTLVEGNSFRIKLFEIQVIRAFRIAQSVRMWWRWHWHWTINMIIFSEWYIDLIICRLFNISISINISSNPTYLLSGGKFIIFIENKYRIDESPCIGFYLNDWFVAIEESIKIDNSLSVSELRFIWFQCVSRVRKDLVHEIRLH